MRTLKTILFFSALIMLFSMCKTESWYTNHFFDMKAKYPIRHADECANSYPTNTSSEVRYKYLPGRIDTQFNEIKIDCDSAVKQKAPILKFNLPKYTIHDTVVVDNTITIEGGPKMKALELREQNAQELLFKATSEKDKLNQKIKNKNNLIFKLAIIGSCFLLLAAALIYFNLKIKPRV